MYIDEGLGGACLGAFGGLGVESLVGAVLHASNCGSLEDECTCSSKFLLS